MEQSPSDPLSELAQALMQRPEFESAARLYFSNLLQWRRALGFANRLTTDPAFHVLQYVIQLDASPATTGDGKGATYTNLLKICQDRKQCASRALRTILGLASFAGYLQKRPLENDQRITVYQPSAKLLTDTRRFFAQTMACIDIIEGHGYYAEKMLTDATFLPHVMATAGGAYIEQKLAITEYSPDLHELIQLRGGCPTLIAIVDAQIRRAPFPTPLAIARDFHISSSQVRNVLEAAKSNGQITTGPNGQIENADVLAGQFKTMLARELAMYCKYALGLEPKYCPDAAITMRNAVSA